MTGEELKQSILQMAIQGKLVPQDPENDEPAWKLLERIKKEKDRLIKGKKIKKEKPLPPITQEEKPFEIPNNWEWVRLGDTITLISGQDMTPDKYFSQNEDGAVPYITGASNIQNNHVIINRFTRVPKSLAYKGNLLLTCKGTVGLMAYLEADKAHIARQIMAINPIVIKIDYIKHFLARYVELLRFNAKSLIPGIDRKTILHLSFPLPPLEEQKRIVAKLE
ncbi:MAG: restriction endonuclease subunit S, partial [Allobaculum sp.]|nr:restriction endonuclease subunit S [Allobaculum sp.]